jgi:hypothetical protein
MPILIMGLSALMVFGVMGILLFSAARAEHREREKDCHHLFPMV